MNKYTTAEYIEPKRFGTATAAVAVIVFALACAATATCFAAVKNANMATAALDAALSEAVSAAEGYKRGEREAVETLYDEDWNAVDGTEDSGAARYAMRFSFPGVLNGAAAASEFSRYIGDEEPYVKYVTVATFTRFVVTVYDLKTDKVIYSLSAAKYY